MRRPGRSVVVLPARCQLCLFNREGGNHFPPPSSPLPLPLLFLLSNFSIPISHHFLLPTFLCPLAPLIFFMSRVYEPSVTASVEVFVFRNRAPRYESKLFRSRRAKRRLRVPVQPRGDVNRSLIIGRGERSSDERSCTRVRLRNPILRGPCSEKNRTRDRQRHTPRDVYMYI